MGAWGVVASPRRSRELERRIGVLAPFTLQPTKEDLGSTGIADCALAQATFDLGVRRRLALSVPRGPSASAALLASGACPLPAEAEPMTVMEVARGCSCRFRSDREFRLLGTALVDLHPRSAPGTSNSVANSPGRLAQAR